MFNNDPFEDMGYIRCNNPQSYTVKELKNLLTQFNKTIENTEYQIDKESFSKFLHWIKKEEKK